MMQDARQDRTSTCIVEPDVMMSCLGVVIFSSYPRAKDGRKVVATVLGV